MLIRFNQARILDIFGQKILPGVQEISSELYAVMKSHKTLKAKLASGEIEVLDESQDAIASFLLMKPSQIKDVIKNTHDLQLLSDWLAREPRESVKALVKERADSISKITYRDGTTGQLKMPEPRVSSVTEDEDLFGDESLELDEPAPAKKSAPKKKGK